MLPVMANKSCVAVSSGLSSPDTKRSSLDSPSSDPPSDVTMQKDLDGKANLYDSDIVLTGAASISSKPALNGPEQSSLCSVEGMNADVRDVLSEGLPWDPRMKSSGISLPQTYAKRPSDRPISRQFSPVRWNTNTKSKIRTTLGKGVSIKASNKQPSSLNGAPDTVDLSLPSRLPKAPQPSSRSGIYHREPDRAPAECESISGPPSSSHRQIFSHVLIEKISTDPNIIFDPGSSSPRKQPKLDLGNPASSLKPNSEMSYNVSTERNLETSEVLFRNAKSKSKYVRNHDVRTEDVPDELFGKFSELKRRDEEDRSLCISLAEMEASDETHKLRLQVHARILSVGWNGLLETDDLGRHLVARYSTPEFARAAVENLQRAYFEDDPSGDTRQIQLINTISGRRDQSPMEPVETIKAGRKPKSRKESRAEKRQRISTRRKKRDLRQHEVLEGLIECETPDSEPIQSPAVNRANENAEPLNVDLVSVNGSSSPVDPAPKCEDQGDSEHEPTLATNKKGTSAMSPIDVDSMDEAMELATDRQDDDLLVRHSLSQPFNQRKLSPQPEELPLVDDLPRVASDGLEVDEGSRTAMVKPTVLDPLSDSARQLQIRYLTVGKADLDQADRQRFVLCFICSGGHPSSECRLAFCTRCSLPISNGYPSLKRCRQCALAHIQDLSWSGACSLCPSTSHMESECDNIWRHRRPQGSSQNIETSTTSCYFCGSSLHCGADCPQRLSTPSYRSQNTIPKPRIESYPSSTAAVHTKYDNSGSSSFAVWNKKNSASNTPHVPATDGHYPPIRAKYSTQSRSRNEASEDGDNEEFLRPSVRKIEKARIRVSSVHGNPSSRGGQQASGQRAGHAHRLPPRPKRPQDWQSQDINAGHGQRVYQNSQSVAGNYYNSPITYPSQSTGADSSSHPRGALRGGRGDRTRGRRW